jgi:undecaprenyl pyrophosphate phosphatase UppP
MGVDRELAKALGYFGAGVIALGAGASALIAFGTGNSDAILLFMPLLVAYSAFIALLCIGLALYVIIRSRTQRLD